MVQSEVNSKNWDEKDYAKKHPPKGTAKCAHTCQVVKLAGLWFFLPSCQVTTPASISLIKCLRARS
jgi:hypothetical protein